MTEDLHKLIMSLLKEEADYHRKVHRLARELIKEGGMHSYYFDDYNYNTFVCSITLKHNHDNV